MFKYEVVFYEVFDEEQTALKKFLHKMLKAKFFKQTIQESKFAPPLAPVISIRTQSRIPSGWLGNIKAVLTRSQGYDHLQSIKDQVACGYLANYSARAVAEHAIMTMMVLQRRLKRQIIHFKKFNRDSLTGSECKDKNALILGVGAIGSEIVRLARALKMNVHGVDLVQKDKKLKYVSLKEGVMWADVIFCALPLTTKTNRLLNYTLLKRVNHGTILINISRGEISPLPDVKRLLDQDILGGLSLDVYPQESFLAAYLRGAKTKISADIKIVLNLKDRDNVLFTPHNAFNTQEALKQKAFLSVEAVKQFLKNKKFPHIVS